MARGVDNVGNGGLIGRKERQKQEKGAIIIAEDSVPQSLLRRRESDQLRKAKVKDERKTREEKGGTKNGKADDRGGELKMVV